MLLAARILLSGWESLRPVPKNLIQLGRYRWCGHGVLMGKIKNEKVSIEELRSAKIIRRDRQ